MILDLSFRARTRSSGGFTLIEVLVYLALFALLFGGAVAAAFNVVELSGRNQTKAMLQEEGNFLLAKINWALSGAQSVSQPALNTSGSRLAADKITGADSSGNPITSSVSISPAGASDVSLTWSGNSYILNTSGAQVSNLSFAHRMASGDGINPESLNAGFTLTAKSPGGISLSQDFFSSAYLRK